MLLRNPGLADSRVHREARTLAEGGYRVTIVAKREDGFADLERHGDATIERVPLRPARSDLPARLARARRRSGEAILELRRTAPRLAAVARPLVDGAFRVSAEIVVLLSEGTPRVVREHWVYWLDVRAILRRHRPDVVHAHDLGTLFAAWAYCRSARVPFVYDAHELETTRRGSRRRHGPVARWIDCQVERIGMKAAAATLTVSRGMARELAALHGVPEPAVILNCPGLEESSRAAPTDLRAAARLEADDVLALYVGNVIVGRRGVEELVQALALLPRTFHLGVLGFARPRARATIDELARELGLTERVHWFPPAPWDQVASIASTATCSLIPLQQVHRSYEVTLPNKLFESIMAGIPVGVSRLEEPAEFVRQHGIGVVFDETDPAAIAHAMRELAVMAHDDAGELQAVFDRLQPQFAWERQGEKVLAIYGRMAPVPGSSLAHFAASQRTPTAGAP